MRRAHPLAGGGAPAAWMRAIARAAAGVAALRRASGWVPALAGVRPRLLARGAWDEGLAALAAGLASRGGEPGAAARPPRRAGADPSIFGPLSPAAAEPPRRAARARDAFSGLAASARTAGSPSAAHPPSRPPFAHPPFRSRSPDDATSGDAGAAGGRSRRASSHASSSRPPPVRRTGMAGPATLPRQADAGLLHSLAGRTSVATAAAEEVVRPARNGGASPHAPSAFARRAISSLPASASPRHRPVPAGGSGEDAARDGVRWIERAAARAARGLAAGLDPGAEATTALAEQWGAPIAAPPVTTEWLAGLAAPRVVPDAAAGTPTRRATGGGAHAGHPSAEAVSGSWARDGIAPWPVEPAPPADAEPGDDAPPPHPADQARVGTVRPARLPPLPPERGGGHPAAAAPAPFHVPGAAAVRLPGAPDEDGAGEDLGELARRIKTILDDEARRFGIDV